METRSCFAVQNKIHVEHATFFKKYISKDNMLGEHFNIAIYASCPILLDFYSNF